MAAQIEDIANGFGCGHQLDERIDDIRDVTEAARLVSIAINFQRLMRQSGGNETGEDHSIHANLQGFSSEKVRLKT